MKKYYVRHHFNGNQWEEIDEKKFNAWVKFVREGGISGNTDGVELFLDYHTKIVDTENPEPVKTSPIWDETNERYI